jgi:multiple sugar transport system substrate-binding protein
MLLSMGLNPVAEAENVTLEFWMPGQEATIRETMEGIILAYENAHPDVKINYTQVPWNDWFPKVTAAIAGNMVPDVTGLGYGQFGMLVVKDLFAEIPLDGADKQDIAAWALKAGSYQGKQYAVFFPETRPLAYRKDFFEEAGLDPEKPPTTWDELTEYAVKLTKREGGKVTRAGIDIPYMGGVEQTFLTFYAMKKDDGHLWEEGGKPVFYTPEGIEALQYLVDLRLKHDVVIPSDLQSVMGTAFESGVAAMGFPKSQGLPLLLASKPGQIGFAVPPKEESSKALTLGTFLAVYKKSKHQEAAFDFIKYLYSPESMWQIYKGILFLPTRKSLQEQFLADADYNAVLLECITNSVSYNVNPHFGEARQAINDELVKAFLGKVSAEEALKTAHDRLMEIAGE